MKFIRVLWSVLIVLFNLHEVADGQAQTNVTGTKVSANVTGTKVPDGQGISNATGTQVSTIVNGTKTPDAPAFTNTNGTQVSTNATGTLVPTNATGTQAFTNATGTLVPTNATGTQVFTNATATLVPTNTTGTLVPTNATGNQRGSWNTGTYKKPNWLWKDLHFVVTIKEPEIGDPLHKTLDFAIGFWAYSTCIEFILTKDEKTDLVFKRGRECSVDYGTPGTPSIIHVNDSCSSLRHVHHFLGHYMGLFDEQRRPDRDEYIEILQKDLPPATQKLMSKFDSSEVNLYSTMYDLSSVMHMSPRSVDDGDKAIFRTKNPKFRGIPGRVVHPSHRDYYRVSAIHGCQERFQKEMPGRSQLLQEWRHPNSLLRMRMPARYKWHSL
ncbi:zinc metalloproteinase nas-23-like [Macrobrachium rosenbergii]|uniref:zinc metalloproteinase nas-23-like n=1 Tax=Macrobrachium rosenbergii TaxID=79674 RepID=UPI0034D72203